MLKLPDRGLSGGVLNPVRRTAQIIQPHLHALRRANWQHLTEDEVHDGSVGSYRQQSFLSPDWHVLLESAILIGRARFALARKY